MPNSFLSRHKHTLGILSSLVLASSICFGLIVLRAARTHEPKFGYLLWNLFLAWIPLLCALAAYQLHWVRSKMAHLAALLCAAMWLLFFPNAPYVLTDLLHLRVQDNPIFWYDLILLLAFAWTSFLLGCISLYLMHDLVTHRLGRWAGWAFALATLGLSSFGIYLGRFLRWNSWDVIFNPHSLWADIWQILRHPIAHRDTFIFSLFFSLFSFSVYVTLFSFSRLQGERRRIE